MAILKRRQNSRPGFTTIADDFAYAFEETDMPADRCNRESNFFAALEWIVSQRRTG
jgi:hypothetical protein